MASTSDIRKGLCIKYNHDIFKIIEFMHVKPGKGPAFVRTKLKSVTTGKVIDNTFSSGHKIEELGLKLINFNFYINEDTYHFMNKMIIRKFNSKRYLDNQTYERRRNCNYTN